MKNAFYPNTCKRNVGLLVGGKIFHKYINELVRMKYLCFETMARLVGNDLGESGASKGHGN